MGTNFTHEDGTAHATSAAKGGGYPYLILGQYFVTPDRMNGLHEDGSGLLCNARLKTFPDGSQEVLVCERAIFKPDGWERADKRYPQKGDKRPRDRLEGEEGQGATPGAESHQRAMRRARAQVRELALANDFRYFVTLTLDMERVDRYDMKAILAKLKSWLDNNVRRRGLVYVLVPEHHKDGAIHFHGLFNDALDVVDSGHTDKGGHRVYNLPRWGFGFSTAIELYGEYGRAVAYVCKYIGKQTQKIGGRWYYSGGDLKRPEVSYFNQDLREAAEMPGAYTFTVEAASMGFAGYRLEPEGRGGTDDSSDR